MSLDSDFRRNSCYFHSVQFCYHFLSICCAPYMPLISHSDDDPMLNTYCGGGGGGGWWVGTSQGLEQISNTWAPYSHRALRFCFS